MFLITARNYNKWTKWRQRKLLFCLLSGFMYGVVSVFFNVVYRLLFNPVVIIETSLAVSAGSFLGGCFFSLAIWFENERRFKNLSAS